MGGEFEPPVTGTANYTQSRYSDRPPPTTAKTEPQSPTQASDADGIRVNPAQPVRANRTRSGSNVAFAEGEERTAAPYRKSGGEKVRISTDDIKRSSSVRDAPAYANAAKNDFSPLSSTSSRHRSVSPRWRAFHEHPPQNMPAFTHMGAHTVREKMKAADPRRFFEFDYSGSSDESEVKSPNSSGPGAPPVSEPPPRGTPLFGEQRPKAQPRPPMSRVTSQQANQNGNATPTTGPATPPVNGSNTAAGAPPMYDISHYFRVLEQQKSKMPPVQNIWSQRFHGHMSSPQAFRASHIPGSASPRSMSCLWSERWPLVLEKPATNAAFVSKPPYLVYPSSFPPKTNQQNRYKDVSAEISFHHAPIL